MKIINRQYFKLPTDLWGSYLPTADGKRVASMVTAAVRAREFVSILGQRGSGKTWAVREALAGAEVKIVEPLRLTRDKLHMGDIETAIVRELSDESPRRSGEARSHQVRRILGSESCNQNIILIIDDAHVLHGQTLRSLKRLRELVWMGRSPLLGIILVGQKDRTQGLDEVRLRSDQLWLEGLTAKEITMVLETATGKLFDRSAVQLIAKSRLATNWLDLQSIVDACLEEARARGLKSIDRACVEAVLQPQAKPATVVQPAVDDEAASAYLRNSGGRQVA